MEVENGSQDDRFLYNRVIFHFHDYGRRVDILIVSFFWLPDLINFSMVVEMVPLTGGRSVAFLIPHWQEKYHLYTTEIVLAEPGG